MATKNPGDTIRRIAATAQSGRLDEAARLAAEAMTVAQPDPALPALAGAIEFHRGQFASAIPYLEQAQRRYPTDVTIRANLAESLYRCGQSGAALKLCDEASSLTDKSLRLARLGAFLAQETGDADLAVRLYRHVVTAQPTDWECWNNLGNALKAQGNLEESLSALEKAAALAPDSPPLQVNLGNAYFEAGRGDDAERVLSGAARDFADDHVPLLSLFSLYRAMGREDEAFDAVREAARRAPDDAHVQSDYGQEAARRNAYDEAESAFEAALTLVKNLGPAFVGLASVYERMNREAELEPLRERAIAAGVDEASLSFIDALRFKRAGELEAAFDALERAGDVVVPGRKYHLRGTILDRMNRPDDAFEAFIAMNEHWQADPSQPRLRAREYRDMVVQSRDLLTQQWLDGWQPFQPTDGRVSPIFLVGFPRSGTTLLDTMMMADPRVVVLEEEPFIGEIERDLGGVDALPGLDAQALLAARASYFEKVGKLATLTDTSIIVDKHPMHLNKVQVIRRIFPDARFLLILRHPCDVLLSCFLTNFRINMAMANFLDLDDAATLYDLTFSHWEKAKALFDLPVGTVVYERLVADQERELRPLFDWLGLDWPDIFDHRASARARGTVRTASYAQVTEPIYNRAAGRWRRYEKYLEPTFDRLRPWAERFGYGIDDDRIPDFRADATPDAPAT